MPGHHDCCVYTRLPFSNPKQHFGSGHLLLGLFDPTQQIGLLFLPQKLQFVRLQKSLRSLEPMLEVV